MVPAKLNDLIEEIRKTDRIKILKIRPMENPEIVSPTDISLKWLQEQVGGHIEAVYPFDDPVAIVCDEEGKLKGKRPNRALNKNGHIYDILCGDFLIVSMGDEYFCGLSDEMAIKYAKYYWYREYIWYDIELKMYRSTFIDDEDWENDWNKEAHDETLD